MEDELSKRMTLTDIATTVIGVCDFPFNTFLVNSSLCNVMFPKKEEKMRAAI